MSMIADNIGAVQARIMRACVAAGRPVESVTLLAVSKRFPAEAVREAAAAGLQRFGENLVQEGIEKIAALRASGEAVEWHLIGPLQSNKTRVVAEHFDWVHSLDRLRIAERLAEQRPPQLPPLQVCVQVNISGEDTKSGVAPADVAPLAEAVAALPRLRLRGLMAIPEPVEGFEAQRVAHRALRRLFDALVARGCALDTLSIGMSDDVEAAIAEGSTLVRVGTAIFGTRPSG
jgi:pyridoxal phosphate enzyme (YggS family)